MTDAQQFEQAHQLWFVALAPRTLIECRLVSLIAGQNCQLIAALAASERRETAEAVACLIESVTNLQRHRQESAPPPPPPASSKVIEIPKRRMARPTRPLQLMTKTIPSTDPAIPKIRATRRLSLDWRFEAA